jgi:hypothetical protein
MCQFTGLRLEVNRVNRASREVKDSQERQRITEADERTRVVEQISVREIFVKNISEAGDLPTEAGSFDFVRLAPHFAQDDWDRRPNM